MALGADWCNAARGFMFAVGCIQSQSCHTDKCPTGVATQDPHRQKALVVEDKLHRVANFHKATVHALAELTAAAGLDHPNQFRLVHISHRLSPSEVATFADLYPALRERELAGRHRQSALAAAVGHGQRKIVPRRGLSSPNLLRRGRSWPSNWRNQDKRPRERP